MQQWKFFRISVNGAELYAEDFNVFLHSHRFLAVHREFVVQGESSYWALAVEYLPGRMNSGPSKDGGKKEKIDYREILSPDAFARFSVLREWRKQAAQEDAVPVYTILTNEQMAEIAKTKCRTKAELSRIEGIGTGRIEKYFDAILSLLKEGDEKDRESVSPDS